MSPIKRVQSSSQLVRFGLVGATNTALDFGLLFVFKMLGLPIGIANIASTGIAFVFSFFANKRYTFKTSGTNVRREMLLFVLVTLTGLWVVQTIIIGVTLPMLAGLLGSADLGLLASKLVATAASLTWNYIFYSRLVFKKH